MTNFAHLVSRYKFSSFSLRGWVYRVIELNLNSYTEVLDKMHFYYETGILPSAVFG